MTESDQDTSINAQAAEPVEVPIKNKGGRPPKSDIVVPVNEAINITAPDAMELLRKFITRKKGYTSLSRDLLSACYYVIDHAIGKARQKVEHSGGITTYADLAKAAGELDKKPRPILADALEIAHSYQESNPVDNKTPE